MTHVVHEIPPVFNSHSHVLLLGTMPSPKSREQGFFYGHPQNRFWRVMAELFDEPVAQTIEEKKDLLLRHRIALWDVLSSCDIEGASDASITHARPNDLRCILEAAGIQAIFATGTKAGQLYKRLIEPELGIPCTILPSTSPANARMRLPELVRAYREALAPYVDFTPTYPALQVKQVVALEQAIAQDGTSLHTLMHRAGRFLGYEVAKLLQPRAKVAILCGHGNNAGDGWVAATYLQEQGCQVTLISTCDAEGLKAEPAHTTACEIESAARANDATSESHPASAGRATNASAQASTNRAAKADTHASEKESLALLINPTEKEVERALDQADCIIDAILGTGFSGTSVREPFARWITLSNKRKQEGCLVVAADVPSGLSAKTGQAAQPCLEANLTVTMITLKTGLVTKQAARYCGALRVAPIADFRDLLE